LKTKTNKVIKTTGYDRNIQEVWQLKDRAYQETKNLNYLDYLVYIQKDLQNIKIRLKDKYVSLSSK